MIVVQLSDTHVVRPGATYFGIDTAQFLADAVAALHALERRPDCVVVTGDLVNGGRPDEYARFRAVMEALETPYFVIPGNHDDRAALREALPPETYGRARAGRVRYAVEDFEVRILGLDANASRPWPGAAFDAATLDWLDDTLARAPGRPALLCVHQPPFRTGLHYLDAFGFRGARRLRAIVMRHPQAGRIISGHIHCVRSERWGSALVSSGPSTAPQEVPLLFMEGTVAGLRREAPGFVVHEWTARSGFDSTVHRRGADGRYRPATFSEEARARETR